MSGRSKRALAMGAIVVLTYVIVIAIDQVRSKPEPLYQGRPVSYWIHEFQGTNPATMGQAYLAFQQRTAEAVPFLAKAASAHDSFFARSYRSFWRKAVPRLPLSLGSLLPQPKPDVSAIRSTAINSLTRIGPPAAEAVRAIFPAVKDADPKIRTAAVSFLVGLGTDARVPIGLLIRIVSEKDEGLAWAGLTLIGKVAPISPTAIRAVTQTLKHESFRVRGKAAITLGQFGPAAKESIPALQAALKDEYWNVREAVAEALRKIETGPG